MRLAVSFVACGFILHENINKVMGVDGRVMLTCGGFSPRVELRKQISPKRNCGSGAL